MTHRAEQDWSVHLLKLGARAELGRISSRLFVDLPALAQPWACATERCTPGRRAAGARSCCADLEVAPAAEERAALSAALPEIAVFLADRDPRWAEGAPPIFDGEALRRPGRRCVFALPARGDAGLSCALHTIEDATGRSRGALKPLPCRLFPLVLVDIDTERTLLTALSDRTWRLAQSRPARTFPCIGLEDAPTVAESTLDTLTTLFGPRQARSVVTATRAWRAREAAAPTHD